MQKGKEQAAQDAKEQSRRGNFRSQGGAPDDFLSFKQHLDYTKDELVDSGVTCEKIVKLYQESGELDIQSLEFFGFHLTGLATLQTKIVVDKHLKKNRPDGKELDGVFFSIGRRLIPEHSRTTIANPNGYSLMNGHGLGNVSFFFVFLFSNIFE